MTTELQRDQIVTICSIFKSLFEKRLLAHPRRNEHHNEIITLAAGWDLNVARNVWPSFRINSSEVDGFEMMEKVFQLLPRDIINDLNIIVRSTTTCFDSTCQLVRIPSYTMQDAQFMDFSFKPHMSLSSMLEDAVKNKRATDCDYCWEPRKVERTVHVMNYLIVRNTSTTKITIDGKEDVKAFNSFFVLKHIFFNDADLCLSIENSEEAPCFLLNKEVVMLVFQRDLFVDYNFESGPSNTDDNGPSNSDDMFDLDVINGPSTSSQLLEQEYQNDDFMDAPFLP